MLEGVLALKLELHLCLPHSSLQASKININDAQNVKKFALIFTFFVSLVSLFFGFALFVWEGVGGAAGCCEGDGG